MDAVIVTVAHKEFSEMKVSKFDSMYREGQKIIIDVKGIYDKKQFTDANYIYWRL